MGTTLRHRTAKATTLYIEPLLGHKYNDGCTTAINGRNTYETEHVNGLHVLATSGTRL